MSIFAQEEAGNCSSGLVEMKSLGKFALWVDLCERSGITSLGTFPLTTMEATETEAVSAGTFESQANLRAFGRK